MEFFEQMNHWHWLTFGLLLLAGELLGTAGYFFVDRTIRCCCWCIVCRYST